MDRVGGVHVEVGVVATLAVGFEGEGVLCDVSTCLCGVDGVSLMLVFCCLDLGLWRFPDFFDRA